MSKATLGSLFDGSGGFPLAGSMCGIEPVWASEVEPYPIAVTRSRFPKMKHLGDISKINGAEIKPVDIVTFGSPCQDLSVAGKRVGIKHEGNGDEETTRSGLFMEAVRIIKEMRKATHGKYPTFALWENVPGAFSSNGGEDFHIVLEELIKIVEPTASMPSVPKNGWAYADCYMGDGWSLAYRVFDAQYWGVPQRRRRIHLVLDLRGERAREVLFEREGLRGYFAEGRSPWKATAAHAEDCSGADDRAGTHSVGFPLGFRPENVRVYDETATTICNGTRPGFCNGVVAGIDLYNQAITGAVSKSMTSSACDSDHVPCVCYDSTSVVVEPVGVLASSAVNAEITGGSIAPCLMARAGTGGNQLPLVAYSAARCGEERGLFQNTRIVRRLTPTECARLQGFPDRWGDIDYKTEFSDEEYRFWLDVRNTHATVIGGKEAKKYTAEQMLKWYNKLHTDSAEYKMWGNGIALPPALYCLQGIERELNALKEEWQ